MPLIPDDITPDVILDSLRAQRIGRPVTVLGEVGSTNDVALEAARGGAAEGLTVLADRQTAGRGRRGRRWASPPGVGVYLSVLLRPGLPPRKAPLLGLAAGLAVAEAVEDLAGMSPELKWPNDVLLGGKKLAGVLPELATEGDSVSHVVVGVGLNLNHRAGDFPDEVRGTATSLRLESGRAWERGRAAAAILNALDGWYQRFLDSAFEKILEAYHRRSATLGRPVSVLIEQAGWQGEAVGLDPEGALLVRDGAGALRRVVAGEVSVREVRGAPSGSR